MDRTSPPALHPARLPPGTQVGPWRVEGWSGCGVYGAVYQAVPAEGEHATPVALKLALHPADPRFAREVELLSRLSHPHVPRLLGHGEWQHPSGTLYPFVHVKGDNILVRRTDGCAVLTDFGTGIYPGAATLTPPMVFPGTPAYRSPESWMFELQFYREPAARYFAKPADDLYALGVTACRLLTGEYPEPGEPTQDEHGTWHLEAVLPPPALLSNPHVEQRLRALVLRMLSVRPEQRGTAAELAEALEQATEPSAPESTQPRFTGQALLPPAQPPERASAMPVHSSLQSLRDDVVEVRDSEPRELAELIEPEEPVVAESSAARGSTECFRPRASLWPAWTWLTLAAAGLTLTVWTQQTTPGKPLEESSAAGAESSDIGSPDAGTTGLGEAAANASIKEAPAASTLDGITEDTLPEPLPGQTRPNEKGRCPHKRLVSLNQACWAETAWDREECSGLGGQMFKGTCYVPFIPRGRPPTSSPGNKP